jgi:hypothetical protein
MRGLRQAGVVFAVLVALLVPTMRCALADSPMTAEERACCKSMHSECGAANMPMSHGCCVKQAANHPQAVQPKRLALGISPSVASVVHLLPDYFEPDTQFGIAVWQSAQPPGNSPPSQSPLRI